MSSNQQIIEIKDNEEDITNTQIHQFPLPPTLPQQFLNSQNDISSVNLPNQYNLIFLLILAFIFLVTIILTILGLSRNLYN